MFFNPFGFTVSDKLSYLISSAEIMPQSKQKRCQLVWLQLFFCLFVLFPRKYFSDHYDVFQIWSWSNCFHQRVEKQVMITWDEMAWAQHLKQKHIFNSWQPFHHAMRLAKAKGGFSVWSSVTFPWIWALFLLLELKIILPLSLKVQDIIQLFISSSNVLLSR